MEDKLKQKMKTQKTQISKSVLGIAVLFPVIALFGRAKSIDHYVENKQDLESVLTECVVKYGRAALVENRPDLSGDCKNAAQAARKIEALDAAKREEARKAEVAAYAAKQKADAAAKAEELAKVQVEIAAAEAKFKEIEKTERAAYDLREQALTPFSNTEIQTRLNKYATELNKGNAAGAAVALGIEPVSAYAAAQDAANSGGIVEAKLLSFSLQPGVFNFKLKYPGYGKDQPPTGYDLEAKNSALTVSVQLIGKKPTAPGWEKHTDVTTCISFNYGVQVDSQTGLAKFSATGYSVNRVCNKTN